MSAASATAQTNFTLLKPFTLPESGLPVGALADGQDGALYGLTAAGGISNMGTVFMLQRDGSRYATLKSFLGPDGAAPYYGGLVISTEGTLFGTTYSGGVSNYGTIFKINRDGSGFQVLHRFTGGSDGMNPSGDLIQGLDGAIYGITYFSDSAHRGTVFKINQDGTGYAVLHAFTGNPDGQQPRGRLLQTSDGWLYGTAAFGGAANVPGVIYIVSPDGTSYGIVHVFGGTGDGRSPATGLTLGSDGWLYGTTAQGGGTGAAGTVFKMLSWGANYAVLRAFSSTGGDGQHPNTELVEGPDGAMYGTTYQGGTGGYGTIFKLAKDGTGYSILHHYGTTTGDSQSPFGALVSSSSGFFYTTAMYGGGGVGCLSVLGPTPLPPRMLSLSANSASNYVLCATTAGIQYDVQRSTNCTSWPVLITLMSPPSGRLSFSDLSPPDRAAFYRLQQH